MQFEIVSFELAVKLKELGFNYPVLYPFRENGVLVEDLVMYNEEPIVADFLEDYNQSDDYVSAPTLELATKWIRETFKYHIKAEPFWRNLNTFTWLGAWTNLSVNGHVPYLSKRDFNDPENALEFILGQFCDKMLKEKSKEKELPEYSLKDEGILVVGSNFIELDEKIKDEELHEYYIIDRKEFIDDLICWISEAKGSNKVLMKQDLEILMEWEDDYIFSSNSANVYIGKQHDRFNEICEELIELNKSLKAKEKE